MTRAAAAVVVVVLAARPAVAAEEPAVAPSPVAAMGSSAVPLALSLREAIERALATNPEVQLARGRAGEAKGSRLQKLAALMPDLRAHVSGTRQVVNLDAYGFPLPAGSPKLVGPFDVVDARLSLSQTVLDLEDLHDSRAEAAKVAAAEAGVQDARDLVVLIAANLYLQALAAGSRVEAAEAEVALAEALGRKAADMKASGMAAGIELLRAQVQLEAARARLLSARNERAHGELALEQAIGLELGTQLRLTDAMPYAPAATMDLQAALALAAMRRSDLRRAGSLVKAAEERRKAAVAERMPSVRVGADVGKLGQRVDDVETTWNVAAAVSIPLFDGGHAAGSLEHADGELAERRTEYDDLRRRVELEVRTAHLDVGATRELLEAATRERDLAQQELDQAKDRFAAGVGSGIEATEAQQELAAADERHVASLYDFNVAKARLAHAMGVAEEAASRILGVDGTAPGQAATEGNKP